MNRQFRRAQEKQDKKQQKEKSRRREERKAKVRQMRQARRERNDRKQASVSQQEKGKNGAAAPQAGGRMPGRFSGVLAAVTVFFITLQSAVPEPPEEADLSGWQAAIEPYVYPGFYLMLGYFATLWFMRRGTARAPLVSLIGGALLAISVTVAQLIRDIPLEPLSLALVLPALVLGAYLGRLVFVATPR